MSTLIVGTGFVGSVLADRLRDDGIDVTQSSRTPGRGDVTVSDGAALDDLLGSREFEQIVVLGQLTGPDIDWVLERIDGPRWLVMSSQQVTSSVPAPGTAVALAREELALARGAGVLRPTMIFGRGRDHNITRLIAMMRRWRIPVVPGSGDQMVQPLHVDDLCALVACHHRQPKGDLYAVGGAEALPLRELVGTLAELLGLRVPVVEVPAPAVALAARFAPLVRLRPDQFRRLAEPRRADNGPVADTFDWSPEALGLRLEEAAAAGGAGRPRARNRVSSVSRLVVERARGRLYRLFDRAVEMTRRFGLGRRLPILRRVYFALVTVLRPGVVAFGPWTVYFHRGDNAVSHALRNAGTYEPFELELIAKLLEPGDCAVDVGANIGLHSLVMSAACGERGTVLSIEPDPENIALLKRNLETNGCTNVEVLPIAASDRSGTLKLFLNPDNRGDHRMYDSGDGRSSIEIQAQRLDELLTDRQSLPSLIKVDVQGWEPTVLRGVAPLVGDMERFVLVTEFWTEGLSNAGSSGLEYLAMLDDLGLDLYQIDEEERVLRPLPADRSSWLASPRDTNLLGLYGVPSADVERFPTAGALAREIQT